MARVRIGAMVEPDTATVLDRMAPREGYGSANKLAAAVLNRYATQARAARFTPQLEFVDKAGHIASLDAWLPDKELVKWLRNPVRFIRGWPRSHPDWRVGFRDYLVNLQTEAKKVPASDGWTEALTKFPAWLNLKPRGNHAKYWKGAEMAQTLTAVFVAGMDAIWDLPDVELARAAQQIMVEEP